MEGPPSGGELRARKLAITFDGTDADQLVERMNITGEVTTSRSLGSGMLAVSGAGALSAQGSQTVITGVPVGGHGKQPLNSADEAARAFCALEGAFVAVHWDDASETLVVVSDVLGKQPLYWRRSRYGLALFSETKAVMGEPDMAGWGAFIAMGHCLGDRTLVDGVERFPPATVLRYRPADGELQLRRYWEWPEGPIPFRPDTVIEALITNIRDYAELYPHQTLFLSGGWDSRLILHLMRYAGLRPEARIVANDGRFGDVDGRCAVAAAQAAGIAYEFCRPPRNYYASNDYLHYVAAIDAATPSLGLFISKLYRYIGNGGFWDGLMFGGLFRDFHNPGTFQAYEAGTVSSWNNMDWLAARQLFGEETARAMFSAFHRELAEVRRAYPDNAEGIARFTVEQRGRHRTCQNPLKAFANRGYPLIPGLHREVLAVTASIPYAARRHGAAYSALLQRLEPRAMQTPIFTGGKPHRRWAMDLTAHRVALRAALEDRLRRHPRLAHALNVSTSVVDIPMFAREYLEQAADPWIDPRALHRANPHTWDGFVYWRLYFHWCAWRSLHTSATASGLLHVSRESQSQAVA